HTVLMMAHAAPRAGYTGICQKLSGSGSFIVLLRLVSGSPIPFSSLDSLSASDREERPQRLRGKVPREISDHVVHSEDMRTRSVRSSERVIGGDARVGSVVESEGRRAEPGCCPIGISERLLPGIRGTILIVSAHRLSLHTSRGRTPSDQDLSFFL